jgi:ZIP family zinc transporter
MSEFLRILLLCLLPAGGNFGGGLLAEFIRTPPRVINYALHGAAGIILAVVSIELMPKAIEGAARAAWVVIVAFAVGGLFNMGIEWAIEGYKARSGGQGAAGPWMVYVAVASDLFSDGLMLGAGSAVSPGLALLLAVGQLPADIPEGFAAIASFKTAGVSRRKRLLLSASFTLPILLGATISYWLLRGQAEMFKLAGLAFVGGLIMVGAVEDMMREAQRKAADDRLSTLSVIGGYVLFAFLAAYLD